jgi:hypothetical protein
MRLLGRMVRVYWCCSYQADRQWCTAWAKPLLGAMAHLCRCCLHHDGRQDCPVLVQWWARHLDGTSIAASTADPVIAPVDAPAATTTTVKLMTDSAANPCSGAYRSFDSYPIATPHPVLTLTALCFGILW